MHPQSTHIAKPVVGTNALTILQEFLEQDSSRRAFVLVDSNTHNHCLPTLIHAVPALRGGEVLEIEPGEGSKDLDVCAQLWMALTELGANRNSILINLGGGVVGDIGGFVASAFKRGIEYIQIPTSLLAMVDASVGGKTGVNLGHIKNQVGAFYQPAEVLINPQFLITLPERHLVAGYAEMLKHGLILDRGLWDQLSQVDLSLPVALTEAIRASVAIKQRVVQDDPLEGGFRKILNFGHTAGHAIESYLMARAEDVLHGEAVAAGMLIEARLSHKIVGLPKPELDAIARLILARFPALELPEDATDDLLERMGHDKKNNGNGINFTMLKAIGNGVIDRVADSEHIREAIAYYRSTARA